MYPTIRGKVNKIIDVSLDTNEREVHDNDKYNFFNSQSRSSGMPIFPTTICILLEGSDGANNG